MLGEEGAENAEDSADAGGEVEEDTEVDVYIEDCKVYGCYRWHTCKHFAAVVIISVCVYMSAAFALLFCHLCYSTGVFFSSAENN